jgi:hypothetical protein
MSWNIWISRYKVDQPYPGGFRILGLVATAAMTIMACSVIVTPVQRRRSVITDIGWAIVNRGWNVINRWRIDRCSDEGRKPEADPNADPAMCPSRGRGHQSSGDYRSASHRPATDPNATKPRHVHSLHLFLALTSWSERDSRNSRDRARVKFEA